MEEFIGALLGIILIDLVLSGDNAIVIGMAVRNLPPHQKRVAILGGTAGAVALRVVLTALAALLLRVPLLQAAGGVVLVWITYRLLRSSGHGDGADHSGDSFGQAIRMIILADVSMSIDNVLAVGAAAQGDIPLLLFGLSLSLAIIMAGGSLVATLLGKLPWLIYVGGGVLLILSGEMIAEDHFLAPYLGHALWLPWAISAGLAALIAGLLLWARRGTDRGTHTAAPPAPG
jgi:YjbE family integral membrane protein